MHNRSLFRCSLPGFWLPGETVSHTSLFHFTSSHSWTKTTGLLLPSPYAVILFFSSSVDTNIHPQHHSTTMVFGSLFDSSLDATTAISFKNSEDTSRTEKRNQKKYDKKKEKKKLKHAAKNFNQDEDEPEEADCYIFEGKTNIVINCTSPHTTQRTTRFCPTHSTKCRSRTSVV